MVKNLVVKLIIVFNLVALSGYGQEIISNTCDSNILSKEEYEKCIRDSAWKSDINIKINYITNLKTSLLPKYRIIRKDLIIPAELKEHLQQLRIAYDTVWDKKITMLQIESDRNLKYIQPKAYISSLLSFHVFKFYPDIYAVLLNDIQLSLIPRTTKKEQDSYKELFDKSLKAIPKDLYEKLIITTENFEKENAELMKDGYRKIFQGTIEEDYRKQCHVINFLLWNN
jgi:hypothetical protein